MSIAWAIELLAAAESVGGEAVTFGGDAVHGARAEEVSKRTVRLAP